MKPLIITEMLNNTININDSRLIVIDFLASDNSSIDMLFTNIKPIKLYLKIINNSNLKINFLSQTNNEIDIIVISDNKDQHTKKNNILNNLFSVNYLISCTINFYYLNICDISCKETFNFNLSMSNSIINFYLATLAINTNKKEIYINAIHNAKKTKSNLKTYSIIKNHATQVVKCTSNIIKTMENSETHQEIRLLVFDKTATAISDPILLIDENNIIASHANAVGMLNPNDLFYLQSRGLTLNQAKKIIVMGYFKPVIDAISNKELQTEIIQMINKQTEEVA